MDMQGPAVTQVGSKPSYSDSHKETLMDAAALLWLDNQILRTKISRLEAALRWAECERDAAKAAVADNLGIGTLYAVLDDAVQRLGTREVAGLCGAVSFPEMASASRLTGGAQP